MIKIIQERQVKKENYNKLLGLLQDLRAEAVHQPGYITGETLVRDDDGVINILTIGTWVSEDHWKAWLTSEERIEIDDMIVPLLESDARVSVYKMPAEDDAAIPESALIG